MAHDERQYYVYLLTNVANTVIYTGSTNNLLRRVLEHRKKTGDGFTARYNVWKLAHYEVADTYEGAALREKQIKAGSRKRKEAIINASNPSWSDLFQELADTRGL